MACELKFFIIIFIYALSMSSNHNNSFSSLFSNSLFSLYQTNSFLRSLLLIATILPIVSPASSSSPFKRKFALLLSSLWPQRSRLHLCCEGAGLVVAVKESTSSYRRRHTLPILNLKSK